MSSDDVIPDLPDEVEHIEDLEDDNSFAEGDDEDLANADLSRLDELGEQMVEVGEDKDKARDWYSRLSDTKTR